MAIRAKGSSVMATESVAARRVVSKAGKFNLLMLCFILGALGVRLIGKSLSERYPIKEVKLSVEEKASKYLDGRYLELTRCKNELSRLDSDMQLNDIQRDLAKLKGKDFTDRTSEILQAQREVRARISVLSKEITTYEASMLSQAK